MSIIDLRYGNVKPIQWAINPGVVAYNASRMGLPIPVGLCLPVWENGGNKVYDTIRQTAFSVGSSMSWKGNYLQGGSTYDDVNNRIVLDSSCDPQTSWPGLSVAVGFVTHSTIWKYPGVFLLAAAGADDGVVLEDNYAGSHELRFSTDQLGVKAVAVVDASTYYNVVGTWDKINLKIYLDGVLKGTQAEDDTGWTPTNITLRHVFSRDIGGGSYRSHDGRLYYLYFFAKSLTPSQVVTLSVNPYGLVQQPRRIHAVFAAFTTALPTTLAPTTLPTTAAPTSLAPTTLPTTLSPTTLAPTTWQSTAPPTSKPPTTLEPTTSAPTTLVPTEPPTTLAPTALPTTAAPTTLPTTAIPTTLAPTTLPTTAIPTTVAPTTVAPTTIATTIAPTTLLTTLAPTTLLTTSPPTTLVPTTTASTLAPATIVAEICIMEFGSEIVRELKFDSEIVRELEFDSKITRILEFDSEICKV